MNIIKGDLIELAPQFDVIAHGCNCFCVMKRGLAPKMAKAFGCDKFHYEGEPYKGDVQKLGNIEWRKIDGLTVVNAYTQYHWKIPSIFGVPLYYPALQLCLFKINSQFAGKHIGLPKIGCGLAGGDWDEVRGIIEAELTDCEVTIVDYAG